MTNPDNVGGLPELPEPTGWMCIDNYRAKIEFTNLQHVADEWMQDKRLIVSAVNTADQMRAYGELCRAAPAGGEPNGKLVGWWNGITPGFDGMGMPSIRWGADAEDSRHDIPLYDGYNPIHYVTPVSAPAGGDDFAERLWEALSPDDCPKLTRRKLKAALKAANSGNSAPAGSGEAGPILIHAQQLHLDGHMDQCALDELTALLRNLQQGADYVMVPREALRTEARRLRYRAGECWPTFSTGTDAGAQMIGTAESLERLASQDQDGCK